MPINYGVNRFLFSCLSGLFGFSLTALGENAAPIVTAAIPQATQFAAGPARSIDLTAFFQDPDLTSAVRMTTTQGTFDLALYDRQKLITVANFLRYVNENRYFKTDTASGQLASSFIHRSVPGFVIQGGGFVGTSDPTDPAHANVKPTQVTALPAIQNEPGISNKRGTIAMAKLGNDPNSATSQWFINLADNSANLDVQNGGFTVFGRVLATGMAVADRIASLPIFNFASPFDSLPLQNYTSPNAVKVENLVSLPGIVQLPAIHSPLSFSAMSDNASIASVTVSEDNLLVSGLQAGTAHVTVTAKDLDGASVSQILTVNVAAAPGRLGNISTRAEVGNDQNALIGGFFVQGSGTSKRLVIRAIGPSLSAFGITNPLPDPVVELHDANNALLTTNDNWQDNANKQEIIDAGFAPTDPKESVILTTVPITNGSTRYTAVVRDANKTVGVGLVEVYDLDSGPGTTLVNLSTRGHVGTNNDVMIGGFVVSGTESKKFVIRAIGPSLGPFGITSPLRDPMLTLRDENGNTIDSNNDWQTNNPNAAEIQADKLNPSDTRESALLALLAPGHRYTATVQGVGSTPTGVALVEVYQVQ